MDKLITVSKAKEEIRNLQKYIELAESYEANTLEKQIIKEYAYTNSINEIVKVFESRGITKNGEKIKRSYVSKVIDSKPLDELHKILKKGYRLKIKPNKARAKDDY